MTNENDDSTAENTLPVKISQLKGRERVAAVQAKYGTVAREAKQEISDLPRWCRMALVEYETLGLTYKECAAKFGKGESTLSRYGSSPAGQKWRKQVRDVADDPLRVAEATMRANAANVTLDYLMALQSAIEAGDYREIGVMSRDILDRLGVVKKDAKSVKGGAAKPTIVINFGGGVSMERPTVETSWEPAVDADFEVEDDTVDG